MAEQMNPSNQKNDQQPDPHYWRSFEELYRDPETIKNQHNEFRDGVKDDFDPSKDLSGISRRKFLALLGASAALAGAGCSDYRDKGEIVPYNRKPEEITLGKPNYYASSCTACSNGCGILIKTREGRPIKVDGNPEHPINKGKICSIGQAHVLNLYDPARLTKPMVKNGGSLNETTWNKADQSIIAKLKSVGSKEIAIITGTVISPTFKKVLDEFQTAYPTAKVYQYEQFNNSAGNSAWVKLYGNSPRPVIAWDKAKVILSLEGDFLGKDGNSVEQNRLYATTRNVEDLKNFSRLYVIEGALSLTGMNSDYRIPLAPNNQFEFVMSLINEIVVKKGAGEGSLVGALASASASYSLEAFAKEHSLPVKTLELLVADLIANKGAGVVYGGKILDENTQIAVLALNDVLGNTRLYTNSSFVSLLPETSTQDLANLVQKMKAGGVAVVLHVNTNPVFTFPAQLGYAEALKKVETRISLSEFENETSVLCNYVLPLNHDFESWGDVKTRTGVNGLQQPVISPLYDTRQKEAVILVWTKADAASYTENIYHQYLKNNWQSAVYSVVSPVANFEKFWNSALHDGFIVEKNVTSATLSASASALAGLTNASGKGMVLVVSESYSLKDGRFANNGWLQELPHPVSKVTWDNYAAISEKTAKKIGVKTNDVIEISAGGKKKTLPVLVQPGSADNVVWVEAGYGRVNGPVVAVQVGTNVNDFVHLNSASPFFISGVTISKVSGSYTLSSTQDHHSYDDEMVKDLHRTREIIREGTVAKYLADKHFLHSGKKHEPVNMYTEFEYNEVKWGMSIDLNKCTGCGECIIACNVENNIPVVGKEQVRIGREMHWLRVDRYYSGTPENPKVSTQPMLCQHCDQAPCENVCPVVATNHSPDGLNQMVYNRCVGTRYCSNNCPYKVRRFNFYNFRNQFADGVYEAPSMALAANPEVTIRSRGVMEKCTFCVHRISDGRAVATQKGETFTGAGITTACQDACGTDAIVFGNLNDKNSKVAKLRDHELGYVVLEELNIRPNVTYIAKLRNTHSEEV